MEEEILNYFKKQVNVDLNLYRDDRTRQFENKNEIIVDWNVVPATVKRYIMQALTGNSRFQFSEAGAHMKCIKLLRSN